MPKLEPRVEPIKRWTIRDSLDAYHIAKWGQGYFSINRKGHIAVHGDKDTERAIDLKSLIDRLLPRGISLPILIRFTDILRHRLAEIHQAFQNAIDEFEYEGAYRCVYPVKVNQQRHVVQEILDFGREYQVGLEAGSKPELLAVLAVTHGRDVPVICNGFKDDEFIETVMLAQKIGKQVIPVVERFTELELIVKYADKLRVKPQIGVRVKLASRGAGRWESSAGYRSKFGLTSTEVVEAVRYLGEREMADCLRLLHFHLGSQVTNIRRIKEAITEAARVYAELIQAGAGLEMLDVGGGLGIDYDGSQSSFESSVNYTLQEYANDIVFRLKSVCDEAGVAHPTIVSESGRAVVAYHSVLVFNVLGVSGFEGFRIPESLPEDSPQPLSDLHWIARNLSGKNYLEAYHDAVQLREDALNLFNLGYLSLEQRSISESLYWSICRDLLGIVRGLDHVPEEFSSLEALISDTYFCNYSVFQSMPDSWAIDHLFPITPIHRLNEEPTRRAILADITCDSDGRVDRFIDARGVRPVLPLHPFTGRPYYLAVFLVGAYQEILGDLHNLLGDTNAVHVSLEPSGEVRVDHVVKGDRVKDVLGYVEYYADELLSLMRRDIERAVRDRKISLEESGRLLRFYESGLRGYTYLEESPASSSKKVARIRRMTASPHF
ncbi:MAG: biosynthetic arginine decarboxylase [Acidobacteriota bacterium]|nr:biosynthetic arginine decarboxylase [Acidobacteriota bacterium]